MRRKHRLTNHALCRARQRGIPEGVYELIGHEADRCNDAGDGCYSLELSRLRIAELRVEGISPQLLERAANKKLIVSEEGSVVTMYTQTFSRLKKKIRRGNRRCNDFQKNDDCRQRTGAGHDRECFL